MSESSWTSGPWFVGAQNDTLYIIDAPPRPGNDYPVHDAETAAIAKIYHNGIRNREDANARLIAAAPDLYSALFEIMNYEGGAYRAADDPYVMDRAHIALAKARGEALP